VRTLLASWNKPRRVFDIIRLGLRSGPLIDDRGVVVLELDLSTRSEELCLESRNQQSCISLVSHVSAIIRFMLARSSFNIEKCMLRLMKGTKLCWQTQQSVKCLSA